MPISLNRKTFCYNTIVGEVNLKFLVVDVTVDLALEFCGIRIIV